MKGKDWLVYYYCDTFQFKFTVQFCLKTLNSPKFISRNNLKWKSLEQTSIK